MTILQIAAQIPAEYRKEILNTNMILEAKATKADTSMYYLFTIWANYIEQGLDIGCGACLERILKNFRELQPHLVEMERNSNTLRSL